MKLGQSLAGSVGAVLPMFGASACLAAEENLSTLSSGADINVLLGLSGGLRGSVIMGCSQSLALSIVSRMMGGLPVSELDDMGKSALAELGNMLLGTALGNVEAPAAVELSPPTVITGQRLLLLISQVESTRLTFSLDGELLFLSYCTE